MSLYLDTSCLLKLLLPEAESRRVAEMVESEEHVAVSTLAQLEAATQVHWRVAGGHLKPPGGRALLARMDDLLRQAPFDVVRAPAEVIDAAEQHVRALPRSGYCPTLDRLHLAIMQALGFDRLLTNDDAQARAGRALGFAVTLPR
ncbi:type II toxin-antitoxin system VapC family toxin [Candidatus Binatia bacterium]|nr:type II toxin-antitoxin system VapC family toxin [Candidatus Binatia bacterium]